MALPAKGMRCTFADVLTTDETERIEIIEGEAFRMPPPLRVHQEVIRELFVQLYNYRKGKKCKVYLGPFAVRPFEKDGDAPEDVDTMLEPDITVVCDPDKLDEYGCKGAPDLVIEILSPSIRQRDLNVKYRLYQRAGVREYWIVDPDGKTVQVFRLEDGFYGAGDVYTTGSVPVGIWEDFSIDLSQVFIE